MLKAMAAGKSFANEDKGAEDVTEITSEYVPEKVEDPAIEKQESAENSETTETLQDRLDSLSKSNTPSGEKIYTEEKALTLEEQLNNFKTGKPVSENEVEYAGASEYRSLEDQLHFYEQSVSSSSSIFGKKKRK